MDKIKSLRMLKIKVQAQLATISTNLSSKKNMKDKIKWLLI